MVVYTENITSIRQFYVSNIYMKISVLTHCVFGFALDAYTFWMENYMDKFHFASTAMLNIISLIDIQEQLQPPSAIDRLTFDQTNYTQERTNLYFD